MKSTRVLIVGIILIAGAVTLGAGYTRACRSSISEPTAALPVLAGEFNDVQVGLVTIGVLSTLPEISDGDLALLVDELERYEGVHIESNKLCIIEWRESDKNATYMYPPYTYDYTVGDIPKSLGDLTNVIECNELYTEYLDEVNQ